MKYILYFTDIIQIEDFFQIDLLSPSGRKQLERFIEPDTYSLTSDLQGTHGILGQRLV